MSRSFDDYISDRNIPPQTEWFLIKIIWLANFADGEIYLKNVHLSASDRLKLICQKIPSVYKTSIDCGKPIFRLYLKRGELATSLKGIAKRTGQTVGAVRGHILQLTKLHTIEHTSSKVGIILNIKDYDEITLSGNSDGSELTHLSTYKKNADDPRLLYNKINKGINNFTDINICSEKAHENSQEDLFDTPLEPQAVPLGGLNDDHKNDACSESENDETVKGRNENKKTKNTPKPKRTKKEKPMEKSKGAQVWDYYALKFAAKYNVEPLSNAKGYSLSKQLADAAGVEISKQIIDAYFLSSDLWIIKNRHPFGALVAQKDRFLVDSCNGEVVNTQNRNQKQRYESPKLSHDEAWGIEFDILVAGNYNTHEEFEALRDKAFKERGIEIP